jgi:hypothetical protein
MNPTFIGAIVLLEAWIGSVLKQKANTWAKKMIDF